MERGDHGAAVAQPETFFQTLDRCGARILEKRAFPDHHSYTSKDISTLANLAKDKGFEYYVTTEKDAVKLMDLGQRLPVSVMAAIAEPAPEDEVERRIIEILQGVL